MYSQFPSRWKRINELLDHALDLSPKDREAFLERASPDESICKEVEALLAEMEAADRSDFLDQPIGELADEALNLFGHEAASDYKGRRIGPFEMVRELGRGGMGTVYLAKRVDGEFEQRVALKVIKRGMDTDHVLQRFYNERQILAQLEHPNIARLHDGGATEDGLPYFVMEHIEGQPITEYCDVNQLSVEAWLELFEQVCEAVQYAHQNLIVHRDLKPSNILVTDGGTVKLLDFGIAKLLSDEDRPPITQTGMRVLTPNYAAPEQVQGSAVTTATDVYALGLVLYELLTGHRPYRIRRHVQAEIERVICEVNPTPPSTAVSETEEVERIDGGTDVITPEKVSQARGLHPAHLRRRLRGDLDTILLMALRKEPERRYSSAEAFREDLLRHLSGQPVTAQRDTLTYRSKKFVSRNRWPVAAFILALIVFSGFSVQLAIERNRAVNETEKAQEVSNIMLDFFDIWGPFTAAEVRDDSLTAGFLLDAAAERIRLELAEQPRLQAIMLNKIADTYTDLAFTTDQRVSEAALFMPGSSASGKTYHEEYVPKAFKLRNEALEAANRASDLEHHVRAGILISNATVLQGRNEPSQAELLAKEAIGLLKRTDGHDKHLITGHSFLAELYAERGELRRAETQIRKQISIAEELYHPAHVEVVSAIQSLARVRVAQGRLGDSRKTISDLRSRLELGNRPVSDHLLRFARTLQQTGRYAEAEDYLREALQVITATDLDPVYASRDSASTNPIVGSLHENQLIQTLDELGHVLIRQGKFVEAENTLIEYLEPLQRLRASEPVSKAFVSRGALRPYVSVLVAQGKHEAAKTTMRRELTLREEALGDDHPRVAESLQYQGAVLRELGDLQQSEALLRRSLRLHRSGLPQKHWYLSKPLQGLAQTLIARRKFSEAENRLLESHSLFEEQVWYHGSRRIAGLRLLVDLYQKWNRPEDAARYQKELDAVTGAPLEASTGMLS